MSSLMDRINQGMKAQQPAQPEMGQEQIASTLQAKSGKATAPAAASAPQASSLLVDTAKQQAADKLRQIGLVGDIAKTQLQAGFQQQEQQLALGKQQLATQKESAMAGMQATEQQAAMARDAREQEARTKRSAEENIRLDVMQSQATQRLRDLTTQRQIAVDDIFADLEMNQLSLADRRDAARLEQMGFDMAMSDRSYLDELDRVGRERMLYNDLQFQEESARIQLGNDLDLLRDEMSWGRAFNAQRREWEIEVAKIDLNSALEIARADIRANNERMLMQGVTGAVAKAATWGVGKYGDNIQANNTVTATPTNEVMAGQSNLQTDNIG